MESQRRPPEEIPGNRLTLRKHGLEEAERMFGCVERDRARLREFLPWVDATRTVADERGFIELTLKGWDEGKLFGYGIFRQGDPAYLGNIGVHHLDWEHASCELGYWILGDFEGQGYVTEAVLGLERELFALGFNRIEIRCSGHNQRSARVPRRAGYRLEGTLRQHRREQGEFRDTLIFAKLRSDPPPAAPDRGAP